MIQWKAILDRVRAAEDRSAALRGVSTTTAREWCDYYRRLAEVETELAALWNEIGAGTPVGSAMHHVLWSAAYDAARLHEQRAADARASLRSWEQRMSADTAGGVR
ncbi:hypothetical protein [Saccharothrix sp. NRRL B-16314]|uniref:hypothetical protein n=1 Tax=Saccharothrix sp. NRRL B-16314 TaxID=1463825 RepID=UPI0005260147|nr:hypothetical protein [Saccharothrix sp. NRRL B-16314]